jgi:hypothetical protein
MFKARNQITAMALVAALSGVGGVSAVADEAVNFKGKTVTIIVGSEVGGGTDASARLIAPFLQKYLPGEPKVLVQNVPGASGIKAANYFVQRVAPDGLTIMTGSISMFDPLTAGGKNAQYDTKTFKYIGGVGRGGGAFFASKDAIERLYDKTKKPVIIGSALVIPRPMLQPGLWAIEYLGWNAQWIVGYKGTNDVMLALDRGEIDMTATGSLFQIKDRLASGQLKLVTQTGYLNDGKMLGREDYGDTPLFPNQMNGKIKDSVAQKAYEYWVALNNGDKWLMLPPNTPDNIVETYRTAFAQISKDRDFLAQGEKISDGFVPMTAKDVEAIAHTLADTPQESLEYSKNLMRKQGINLE